MIDESGGFILEWLAELERQQGRLAPGVYRVRRHILGIALNAVNGRYAPPRLPQRHCRPRKQPEEEQG